MDQHIEQRFLERLEMSALNPREQAAFYCAILDASADQQRQLDELLDEDPELLDPIAYSLLAKQGALALGDTEALASIIEDDERLVMTQVLAGQQRQTAA